MLEYPKKLGRCFVFSDLHIGIYNDSDLWHSTVREFADWVFSIWVKLYGEKRGNIIIHGDVFDNRTEIGHKSIKTAEYFFDKLKNFDILIGLGNHDTHYKNSNEVHSLGLLKGWENIWIAVDSPIIGKTENGKTFSVIPWGYPIEKIPLCDYCFGHFEINTFSMGGNRLCEKGHSALALLEKSPYVVSGHFHKKQIRQYKQGTIHYTGSPYQQNYGDEGDERGVHIFSPETGKFVFLEFEKAPKHHTVRISHILDKKISGDDIKKIVPNNHIQFVSDREISPTVYSALLSKITGLNPASIRPEYDIKSPELPEMGEVGDLTVEEIVLEYIRNMDIPEKEEVGEKVMEIYRKCSKIS